MSWSIMSWNKLDEQIGLNWNEIDYYEGEFDDYRPDQTEINLNMTNWDELDYYELVKLTRLLWIGLNWNLIIIMNWFK